MSSLKTFYTFWSSIYDPFMEKAFEQCRRRSLALLDNPVDQEILIAGAGTGLDFPWLPIHNHYTAVDLTPAMLAKAQKRTVGLSMKIDLAVGDVQALNFPDGHFDIVIMHLILAVVPDSLKALREATRVVRPHGKILIMDKFLKRGEKAYVRKAVSPILGKIATNTNVVFENLTEQCPELTIIHDEPALAGGWFRHILLERTSS